jgi:hydrogenase maturation protease
VENHQTANDRIALLVLGLGNPLWGDDGLGIAAIEMLRARGRHGEGVRIVDGGTLGLKLLPLMQQSDQILIVDAIRADGAAGALVRVEGDAVAPAVRERLSVHQIGIADLLEAGALTDSIPRAIVLVGLVPGRIDFGLERSAAVEQRMEDLVQAVAEEIRALGHEISYA